MPTIRDRLRAFVNPQEATKSGWVNTAYNFFSNVGLDYPSQNIRDDKWGYAQAYLSVLAVRQAIDIYATMSQSIPSQVVHNTGYDPENDKIVAQSSDVKPRHKLYEVMAHHRKTYGLNAISAMVYNMVIFDTIFVEKIRNPYGIPYGMRVLNSLGMQVTHYSGYIDYYHYVWDSESHTFKPHEIAYEHGFNPFNDLYGASLLQSAINKIQIENSLDRFLEAFFENNATLGLIGAPPPNELNSSLSQEQISTLQKIINDYHQGVKNSFRPLILNTPIDLQVLPQPEVEHHYEVSEKIQDSVLTAFGVNPALIGATDNTSYKEDLPAIENQFINTRLKPVLSQIESLFNIDILPFLTDSHDYRFEFDYSGYQLLTEQDSLAVKINTQKLHNTALSLNEYREQNGEVPLKEFDNLYMVGDVPVPLEEIPNLWKFKFQVPMLPLPDENADSGDVDMADGSEPDDNLQKSHTHDSITSLAQYLDVYSQPMTSRADRFAELESWRKFIDNGTYIKRAFASKTLHGDIANDIQSAINATTSKDDILYIVDWHMAKLDAKSIQSTRIDYELLVEDLIADALNKDITKRIFISRMMQGIRGFGTLAYIDGLADGGVLSEPDDSERAEIEVMVVGNRAYVRNLADIIYDKGLSELEAQAKPAMWYNKSISPFYDAGKMSADKNGMYEFVLGKTEEHCSTCLKANGQVHRLKLYFAKGVYPRSPQLECEGWNCDCDLIRTSANARGRLPVV